MLTAALEELVSRGHQWHDLLDGYSIDLLQNLVRAARMNTRRHLIERTIGLAVAVSNAIDMAFGGKGRPLQAWLDLMAEDDLKTAEKPRQIMSDRANRFLASLPVRRR